jgi:hypothetical protein
VAAIEMANLSRELTPARRGRSGSLRGKKR